MGEGQVRKRLFGRRRRAAYREWTDAGGDGFYQSVKVLVIAGEIDADEMMRLLMDESNVNWSESASKYAVAG